jgi:UDP-N-acetylmuramoylalanine--D-glutamate ligase
MKTPKGFSNQLPTPIVVVGLGTSGLAAYRLLLALGYKETQLTTYDDKDSAAVWNDPKKLIENISPKTLVVSPGVPLNKKWIQDFHHTGGFITSELSLAFDQLEGEKCIGITGSFGKSTTVSILGLAAKKQNANNFVGGNLGTPLAEYVLALKNGQARGEYLVLELSSYQLENFENLNCLASAITSLSPNHMERYPDLNSYYETKWSLVDKTSGSCVLNRSGHDLENFAKRFSSSNIVYHDSFKQKLSNFNTSTFKLLGEHNEDNLLVAFALAKSLGWSNSILAEMFNFRGLTHRLEILPSIKNVHFINDSKSTTIESLLSAVAAVQDKYKSSKNIYVLVGGKDKNLLWQDLMRLSAFKELKFVFFGEVGTHAKAQSQLSGPVFPRLGDALLQLKNQTVADDVVLLSPGGTSLDEFKSFEERGEFFRNQISKLWSK